MHEGNGFPEPAGHENATISWKDDRRTHLITRGNVDGIVSAAFFYARDPTVRVSFVTSTSAAQDTLRRDIQSKEFFLVDLGITPDLVKNLQDKAKLGAKIHLLDHHQQTEAFAHVAGPDLDIRAYQGSSAASVTLDFLKVNHGAGRLAALADIVEYCESPYLAKAEAEFGWERLREEARILDYSWRFMVDDDRFRQIAARKLAEGLWPSEVGEIHRRYLQVVNEGRWERALEKVRSRLVVKDRVGVLRFGRYRTSLFGFGTRALSKVAEEEGCSVAVMINSRKKRSSLSLRGVGAEYAGKRPPLNLGEFVTQFTAEHGFSGGGHPSSAGAKIHTRDVPTFLQEVYCLV
jgi:oligoribonuclease NrnB/cAMP/cGMP phosphodiesterase (DHH superfamily)